ncbi:MAG: lysylphosphatidylglycerol synthase transmembrane domain-containing protein [Hyphomicrobiales bacterium]
MKKKIIALLKNLLFLGIGVVLLYLVFEKVEIDSFISELKSGNYWWMGVALICAIFSHIFRALRWNLLINSMNYKTSGVTTFYAVMVGYLANTAVPRLGEVSRCGVLSKREKLPFSPLLGSVISERATDMIVLLLLIFAVIVFQFETAGSFLNDLIWQPLVGGAEKHISIFILSVVGFVLVVFFGYRYIRRNKERLLKNKLFAKVNDFAGKLLDGIKTIKNMPNKWLFVFYSIMIWVMYLLMIYFPFFILDATSNLNLADALTVLVIGSLGMVAPVPGGLGAYHYIVQNLLMSLYAINSSAAASFAMISHAGQTLMIVAIGAISYYLLILGKRPALNNYEENRKAQTEDLLIQQS